MINSNFIIKSFNYYDKQRTFYSNLDTYIDIKNKTVRDKITGKIYNLKSYNQILGVYHHTTNTFIWGWALPNLSSDDTLISSELLKYGLSLTPESNSSDHYLIKALLVNSRIYVEIDFNLDLILAISSYILKDKCDLLTEDITNEKNTFTIHRILNFSNV